MESNTTTADPPGSVIENRKKRRSRPPKQMKKVERTGDNPQENAANGQVSAEAILVPSSVIRKGDKSCHKLNPAAVEFKPAADAGLPTPAAVSNDATQPDIRPKKHRSRTRKATQDAKKFEDVQVKEGGEVVAKGPRPKRSEPKAGAMEGALTPIQEGELVELSCPICTDSASYFAVGRCNHHVCSLCAVRMRVKSKDTHCAICKENLDVMVIYQAQPTTHKTSNSGHNVDESQYLRPFKSFGLTAADCDVDNGNIPGVQVDHSGGFLFVDCAKHYNEIETLRAMVCPFKHCKTRFPTIQTLQKHLKEQHKDSQLCTLCVENRPLFISEHTVMNPKQLLCHFKGEEYIEAHGHHQRASTTENVHTKGHPQCQFCTERFFDNAALYYHMQRQYFTCHLCPRQHMFRYYIDAAALREHHHRDHIVCNICASSPQLYDSDVAIAFRDAREYSDHMRHVHNAHVSSAAGGASQNKTSFRLGASSTYQSNNPSAVRRDKHGRPRVTVVDLDMGTANPYRTESDANSGNAARAAVMSRPTDAVAAMIPAHMRIAGRVTGAGRFAPLDSEDLLMQAAAEEYAKAAEREARGQKKTLRVSRDQAFPALSASVSAPVVAVAKNHVWSAKVGGSQSQFSEGGMISGDTSTSTNDSPLPVRPVTATAELHPMSLLHSSKLQAKEAQRRKDAETAEKARQEKLRLEDKRIERNLTLASALLGGANLSKNTTVTLTAADVGATLKNRSYVSSITAPLLGLGWSENELMRPIYPPVLVNWARLHHTDLLKIEKKIYGLMTDASLNSVQLKPMARGMRIVVHQLARMYLLNSYEYDPEPNRYVSLVKQVDSYLPSCVLSRAAALPVHTLPGENGTEVPDLPIIFLALSSESYSAGLVNTNSSVSSAGKKAPSQGVTGTTSTAVEPIRIAFTVAEIVSRIKDLLESPELWRAWYQYALEVGAPVSLPPVPELVMDEAGEYHEVPLPPPPPPGFASSPVIKPRALSDLPVPRIESLVSAGASTFGLRFVDRTSAQFAIHFFKFCTNLHYSSNGGNSKMSSRAQHGGIALDAAQLSPKLQQELMVLSVFTHHPAFTSCSVTDLVYAVPPSDKSSPAVKLVGVEVQVAALDRRHYMSATVEEPWTAVNKSAPKAASTSVTFPPSKGVPVSTDGWQFQAVKTRRYDVNDTVANQAVSLHSMPVQDNWEDLDSSDFNQKGSAKETSEDAERAEEWESFLNEKRVKAEQSGVARYQPKRPEMNAVADGAIVSPPAAKYIPPSARIRTQGRTTSSVDASVEDEENEEVLAEVAQSLVDEDDYDLCADAEATETVEPAQVYATDYLDSEEAFEEYLRQMQLQHDQGGASSARRGLSGTARAPREVTAQPYNAALTHVGPSSRIHSSAVPVVAIPIEENANDDDGAESTREVLRRQIQREQETGHYNKFGVLDEEDVDNV